MRYRVRETVVLFKSDTVITLPKNTIVTIGIANSDEYWCETKNIKVIVTKGLISKYFTLIPKGESPHE